MPRRKRPSTCNGGCGTLTTEPYCPNCRPARDDPATRYRNSAEWQRIRRDILTAWVETNGWWCPGDENHAAHPSTDLTVDHLDPLATTGGLDTGRHRVNCRPGNSRRGSRTTTPERT